MLARVTIAALTIISFVSSDCPAEPVFPQAPAQVSWLPHGYGGNMWVHNNRCSLQKGLHGFRTAPGHIGCWSQPVWGWDVNGYYRGPQVPYPDPGLCQLPIGLIYPDNGPPPPNPGRGRLRNASRLAK
jgi:hypothetical protein